MAHNPDFTGRYPKDTYPALINTDMIGGFYNSTGSRVYLADLTSSWAISASWSPAVGDGVGTTLYTGSTYPITASGNTGGTTLYTGSTYEITASWARNAASAISCSWASMSLSASYLIYAGFPNGTASFAITSSNAHTASFVRTASFAISSSRSETTFSSSYSLTSSFSRTSSFADTSSFSRTASFVISASFAISSSRAEVAFSSSYSLTSSFSRTSSFADTASFVRSASFAQNSFSSSYAISASNAYTSSNAITASFAISASWPLPTQATETWPTTITQSLIDIPIPMMYAPWTAAVAYVTRADFTANSTHLGGGVAYNGMPFHWMLKFPYVESLGDPSFVVSMYQTRTPANFANGFTHSFQFIPDPLDQSPEQTPITQSVYWDHVLWAVTSSNAITTNFYVHPVLVFRNRITQSLVGAGTGSVITVTSTFNDPNGILNRSSILMLNLIRSNTLGNSHDSGDNTNFNWDVGLITSYFKYNVG